MGNKEKREGKKLLALKEKEEKRRLAAEKKEEKRRKKLGLVTVTTVKRQSDIDREREEALAQNKAQAKKERACRKNKNNTADFVMANREETAPVVEETVAVEEVVEEPVIEEEVATEEVVIEEEVATADEEIVEETATEKKAKKAPAKKAPAKKVEEDDDDEEVKKERPRNYHIIYREEDGKWQVKREKGARVIKLFDTQAEAIAFAKPRAEQMGVDFVIHKKDGKIRRQRYDKKPEDNQD